ncbi:peroxisomal and mitochondrial division factor 2 isoform X2 [Amborella trichopoda]|uniref:peroxisomal and mitochondrial division factor 2 isoform X2 n=1 Tax=Amborella trichopoda TaxID=13333 RepID=UPI0009BE28FC|nr:peroxisomal and mitochondrial division factor 2 isoform X2 [Amborella trichopoda]|eukprot:XP_020524117.1 peroxisomal and mitochondrial division factor 2 isoform X2 [Amborella trichopoda]
MADEVQVNGTVSEKDQQAYEEDEVAAKPVENGESTKRLKEQVSDLLSKIETLESENRGQKKPIENVRDAEEAAKARLEELHREMDRSSEASKLVEEESNRALHIITARASELEIEVSRLQHDLIQVMAERDDIVAELKEAKDAYQQLHQSSQEKDAQIRNLEKENDSLMEQYGKEREELLKFKGIVGDLKREKSEKEGEVVRLLKQLEEKRSNGAEAEKGWTEEQKRLNDLLMASKARETELEEKLFNMEEERIEVEKRALELEKSRADLKEKGIKFPWLAAAAASTGTIAAAAFMVYLKYSRQKLLLD